MDENTRQDVQKQTDVTGMQITKITGKIYRSCLEV